MQQVHDTLQRYPYLTREIRTRRMQGFLTKGGDKKSMTSYVNYSSLHTGLVYRTSADVIYNDLAHGKCDLF